MPRSTVSVSLDLSDSRHPSARPGSHPSGGRSFDPTQPSPSWPKSVAKGICTPKEKDQFAGGPPFSTLFLWSSSLFEPPRNRDLGLRSPHPGSPGT